MYVTLQRSYLRKRNKVYVKEIDENNSSKPGKKHFTISTEHGFAPN